MSLAGAGAGAGLGGGGLSISHTAGYNTLQSATANFQYDDAQDFDEIKANPISTQPTELTTDQYQALNKHGIDIKNYPHISIDLFGDNKDIVYHVPLVISKHKKEGKEQQQSNNPSVINLGHHIDGDVCIKRTEQSYKILKKFLRSDCNQELYEQVLEHCLTTTADDDNNNNDACCVIKEPYLLLGARRIELVNEVTLQKYSIIKSTPSSTTANNNNATSNAIEPLLNEEDNKDNSKKSYVYIRNQTLDGSNNVQNNDYDRVAFQIHVLDNKKPFFILPEEIVSLQLAKVRRIVQDDMKVRFSYEEDKSVCFLDYPIGLPIPSWALTDALNEALCDACNVLDTRYRLTDSTLHHHRCISSIFGKIVGTMNGTLGKTGEASKLFTAIYKYFPKKQKKFAPAGEEEDIEMESEDSLPLIHFIGVTDIGIEGVTVQISKDFCDIKCLTEVGYQSLNPYDDIEKVLKRLKSSVSKLISKKYRKPTAIVSYGSISSQLKVHATLKEIITNEESSFSSWKKTTLISTKEETTSYGACYLAIREDLGDFGHICDYDVDIKIVSNAQVGVRITSDNENSKNEAPVKVIFDFDRRVPAGPYKLELSAAEYVAREKLNLKDYVTDDEIDSTDIDKYAGSKYIKEREKMAKNLKVQIFQKIDRDGIWIPVGDALSPLVKMEMKKKENDEGDDEEEEVACESSTLQLNLSQSGVLTVSNVGNFESVVKAYENARFETRRYYGILITVISLCIYFFIRSYWEEYTFDRDVKRLLHYYKLVVPGSYHDGDTWNARYLIWKYSGKRHVLWRRLEAKYGEPVPENVEEQDDEEKDIEEEDIDLDEKKEEENDEHFDEKKEKNDEL